MKKFLLFLYTFIFVSCFVAQAGATPLGYGIDLGSNLYSVDLGLGSSNLIGNMSVFFEGIAISPSGNLYGTDTSGNLYSINKINGSTSFIGNTGKGNIEGLDFNGNLLIGSTYSDMPTLFSINITNGSTSDIVTATTTGSGLTRAMTTLNSNTMLLTMGSDLNHYLYSIDLTTGNLSQIGFLSSIYQSFAGLDFARDGNLYGLGSDGQVALINPNDASSILIGDTGSQFWLGLAAEPVPEPATMLLLGTGLVGVAGAARRRKKNQA